LEETIEGVECLKDKHQRQDGDQQQRLFVVGLNDSKCCDRQPNRQQSASAAEGEGCAEDLTVRELAELIRDVVEFKGRLTFDASKPDGTPRKLLDVSSMKQLG
jgi:hypothetical protein